MKGRRVKKTEIKRVVLYARVSTAEQAERDLSIPAQLESLRRNCKDHGYTIAQEYVEPGASGTDDNRKVFKRMLEDLLEPAATVDAILVYHTSRFMRNASRARALKDVLKKRGIFVVSITQEISDDPMGQLVEGIFELIDQYESDVNGMRTSAAMRQNAKQGFFNGSGAPYGFFAQKVAVRGDQEKRRLAPCPEEIPIHTEVFRTYVQNQGAKATARSLNQRGYRYRKGKLWNKDLVLRVIEETAAIGTYSWGKRDPKTGTLTPEEDWIALKVEPIIDAALFEMAQKVRSERDPRRSPGRTGSSPLLLAGLLKCGKCGESYQLETGGKKNAEGEYHYYRYYNCRGFVRTGPEKCKGFRVPTATLEKAVLEHLADRLFTDDKCKTILHDIVEENGALRQKSVEHKQRVQAELDDIEKRLARWQDAFERGEVPKDFGLDRAVELKAKRDELKETIAKVVILRPPPAHLYSEASLKRFQDSIRSLFLSGDNALTKYYLRYLVEEITLTDGHVNIRGRSEAVARMMAASDSENPSGFNTIEGLHTTGLDWLGSRPFSRTPRILQAPKILRHGLPEHKRENARENADSGVGVTGRPRVEVRG